MAVGFAARTGRRFLSNARTRQPAPPEHARLVRALYRGTLRCARAMERRPMLKVFLDLTNPNLTAFTAGRFHDPSKPPRNISLLDSKMNLERATRYYFRINSTYFRTWDSKETQTNISFAFKVLAMMSRSVEIGTKCGYLQAPPLPPSQTKPLPPNSPSMAFVQNTTAPGSKSGAAVPRLAINAESMKRLWRVTELVLSHHPLHSHLAVSEIPNEPVCIGQAEFDPELGVSPYLCALVNQANAHFPDTIAAAVRGAVAVVSRLIAQPVHSGRADGLDERERAIVEDEEELMVHVQLRAHPPALHPLCALWDELPPLPPPVPLVREVCVSAKSLFDRGSSLFDRGSSSDALVFTTQSARFVPTSEAFALRARARHVVSLDSTVSDDEFRRRTVVCLFDSHIAFVLDPMQGQPLCDMAVFMHHIGLPEQARQLLDLAVASPRFDLQKGAYAHRALLLADEGDHNGAMFYLLRSLECSPSWDVARQRCLANMALLDDKDD